MTKAAALLPLPLLCGCLATGPRAGLWEQTGGPYAEDIRCVLAAGRAGGTVYAGLAGGVIAVSAPGGTAWRQATAIPGEADVLQLIEDPERPGRLIAATEGGAFTSTDGAKTWNPLAVGPPGTGVRAIAVDPWAPAVMYAGTTGRGIFRSSDGGKTWREVNASAALALPGADVYDIAIDVSRPDLIFAAVSPYGVVSSSDGGASWRGLTPEFSATSARVTRLLSGGNGRLLYGTSSGSLARTTDNGSTWSITRTGDALDGILSLCPLPGRPEGVVAGTERGVLLTSDFGMRWTPGHGGLPGLPTRVAISADRQRLYAFGCGMGMRTSADEGTTWRDAELRLGVTSVGLLRADPAGEHLFAATGTVCLTYTAGTPGGWSEAGPGLSGGAVQWISVDPAVQGLIYATTSSGVFLSTDNGGSWAPSPHAAQVSPSLYEVHPSIRTRVLLASDQGIFISTDRGGTWNPAKPLRSRWTVRSLTFSPTNAGTIIGATANSGVIISYDGGFTWEQARYGISGDRVDLVTLDDHEPDIFYAYTPGGDCYRTLNRGLEWNRYVPPWKPSTRVRLACDPALPSSVIALVDDRNIYYSPSGGGTWFRIAEAGLRSEAVSLCWNDATKTLYAGARDGGVWMLPLLAQVRTLFGE